MPTCAGERLSARGLQGAAGTPPPTPSICRVEADNPDTQGLVRLSGYPPRLPLPCGWRVDVAKRSWRLHVGPLFSDGGVSGPGALWPQGMRPSGVCGGSLHLPLGTHRAFRRASSITAPLRAGTPHPTQPRPCNQSRSAGSPAWAGSHRYQLTAWVPFPFTRGQLTMADSPPGGPGSPPRERPR